MSRTLAIAAASRDFEDRINLLDAVAADYVDGAVDSYRLREGIEMRAWETLVKWTAREPRGDLGMLRWRYWRARALQETGRAKQALAIFADLAIQRDYYGFLSADQLGDDYRMNDRPIVVTATEEAEMSTRPGILRAHELYRLGMRFNARQEWHHEMKRMTPRELEVAARFAYGWGWYDRVIFALGKAKSYDDLELRFPLEYRELVGQYATKRDIESAVLFSIIRGESAFMSDARSPAGALGLMQLMPATGRETARRIGLKLRGTRDLLDAKKNIMVGSAYLQSMLNRFDGSLPMAAAAYNAGPHRVRVWRPKQGCVPADIWIDTIPFTETRRYVRRSLFYAAVYQRRLEETIAPLSTRLAQITARNSESQC
jgi:soluble lytic murein transglycosylase